MTNEWFNILVPRTIEQQPLLAAFQVKGLHVLLHHHHLQSLAQLNQLPLDVLRWYLQSCPLFLINDNVAESCLVAHTVMLQSKCILTIIPLELLSEDDCPMQHMLLHQGIQHLLSSVEQLHQDGLLLLVLPCLRHQLLLPFLSFLLFVLVPVLQSCLGQFT